MAINLKLINQMYFWLNILSLHFCLGTLNTFVSTNLKTELFVQHYKTCLENPTRDELSQKRNKTKLLKYKNLFFNTN